MYLFWSNDKKIKLKRRTKNKKVKKRRKGNEPPKVAVAETIPKKVEKKAAIEEEVTLERCLCYVLVSLIPLLFLVNQQQLIIFQRALVSSLVPLAWKFLFDINKLIDYFPTTMDYDCECVGKMSFELPNDAGVIETSHPYPLGTNVLRRSVYFHQLY